MLQLTVRPGREKLIEQNLKVLENKQEIKVFGNTETAVHHNSNFKQFSPGNQKYPEKRKQIQKTPKEAAGISRGVKGPPSPNISESVSR